MGLDVCSCNDIIVSMGLDFTFDVHDSTTGRVRGLHLLFLVKNGGFAVKSDKLGRYLY
jgi:hypothetical protein